jgi:hypothetical protein
MIVNTKVCLLLFACTIVCCNHLFAQMSSSKNLVYVDKQGVLRYTSTKAEASFFGVNYTIPFAYGYRSHKALGLDLKKAIDEDVYHMARLGLNAFRVHVWDTEITDTAGNLLANEHLDLFDYLISKLKERDIKIIITPIAFWGNGYPEKDEKTPGFSYKYGKQKALVNDTAIRAQQNYLVRFFKHTNPYTRLTYVADQSVIAMEINNEPHHSGPKEKVTEYINKMADAVKSTGWTKPVFYNISESPTYADAVAKANIDGVSFQWYPTGLVANRTLQGNYLSNVDTYKIPFSDTIPSYRNKARMVYEFDAGDVLQPIMYPAMARSFRTAGFQWATQFAYDPLATAYANTEYQTHYVNLAYTPSKAISLLIASKVFQRVPRLKSYGKYPADSLFDVFRVSYKNQLSEMNADEEFYYSNSTSSGPVNESKLKHIAGVGSSRIVNYSGTGAYFLDKVGNGIWRLEVMPDAIQVNDPFGKASLRREATRVYWQTNKIEIDLATLGDNFSVKGFNAGNSTALTANGKAFLIKPGTYELKNKGGGNYFSVYDNAFALLNEFFAPKSSSPEPYVAHKSLAEVSGGKPFLISATIAGLDTADIVSVELRNSASKWKTISLQRRSSLNYVGEVPTDIVTPGVINYRVYIRKGDNSYFVFPGNHKGYPYAWDAYENDTWETYVAAPNSSLEIFSANRDRSSLNIYNPDWRNNSIEYITGDDPKQLILKATISKPFPNRLVGWQSFFADKIAGRSSEMQEFTTVVIKGKSETKLKVKVAFITADGSSFAKFITLASNGETEIPLTDFKQDSSLLLPRPYPGFQALWFNGSGESKLNISDMEKLEITFGYDAPLLPLGKPVIIEIESVWLKKK